MCGDPPRQNVDFPAASPALILAAQQSRGETAGLHGMIGIGHHPRAMVVTASNKKNQ